MKAEKPPQKKLVKQNIYEPVVKQKKPPKKGKTQTENQLLSR
jgi:hypothetical protein